MNSEPRSWTSSARTRPTWLYVHHLLSSTLLLPVLHAHTSSHRRIRCRRNTTPTTFSAASPISDLALRSTPSSCVSVPTP